MEGPQLTQRHDAAQPGLPGARGEGVIAFLDSNRSFDDRFVELFNAHHPRLFRYLDRLSGDSELAADVVQDAFVRLYQRGSVPDTPGAWLVSVALNLFRNVKSARSRRLRLLTPERGERVHSDPAPSPGAALESNETQQRVRRTVNALPERDRRMLLLRAEGYSYREIAIALEISEASIGTLLARAQRTFRQHYQDAGHAP